MSAILEVKNLNVSYRGRKQGRTGRRQVLHDVSFSLEEGEVLGLVGESGCGKSTLARAVLGLEKADGGQVVCKEPYPQMVFQDPFSSLNPAKTVEWILQEPLRLRSRMSASGRREAAAAMLERVGLPEEIGARYPRQLSGGQRQRVCIGAALMQEPRLLVADEAVSALDVTVQAQIVSLLLRLQKELQLSILFISHDLRVVYQMSDRVMIMKEGRLIETGPAAEVYFSPRQAYTARLLEAAGITGKEED